LAWQVLRLQLFDEVYLTLQFLGIRLRINLIASSDKVIENFAKWVYLALLVVNLCQMIWAGLQ
jgi:hypothetical protein